MAIILEKDSLGNPTKIKSRVFPPTKEEEGKALEFDKLLQITIPGIEKELIKKGLLSVTNSSKNVHGDIKLWFSLGEMLNKIIRGSGLVKPSEYIWALQAAQKYMSQTLLRKDRGSRLHLDYCVRVSELPWEDVKNKNWSDWVYLLDSKSLRSELRADKWLKKNIKELSKMERSQFRHLVKKINSELKEIDTSIYEDKELFSIYNQALEESLMQTRFKGVRNLCFNPSNP